MQIPQEQPYGPIYQSLKKLNLLIQMVEEKIKENSKNLINKIIEMKNRFMIVNKIRKRFPDGIYYGEIQNGNINGLGKFEGDNGDKYEGEWLNGYRNGIGIVHSKNGDIFMGNFKQNERNGFCIKEDSKLKYEGNYNNNYLNVAGIISYKDGDKYIGQINNSKFDGFGKFIDSNGNYFVGFYKNGNRHRGMSFYSKDKGLFVANWGYSRDSDQFKGIGTYYLPDGTKKT